MSTPSTMLMDSLPQARVLPTGLSNPDADAPYLQRASTGDQTAFTPLWEKYWHSLYRYFDKNLRNREEAEDLASESLLAAFEKLPTFRGLSQAASGNFVSAVSPAETTATAQNATFRAFLWGIAKNKLLHALREKKNHRSDVFTDIESQQQGEDSVPLEEKFQADESSDPLQTLLQQEQTGSLYMALADVEMRSSEQFTALFLHYCCHLPHKEVASLFNLRPETVNSRVQEGREKLARLF